MGEAAGGGQRLKAESNWFPNTNGGAAASPYRLRRARYIRPAAQWTASVPSVQMTKSARAIFCSTGIWAALRCSICSGRPAAGEQAFALGSSGTGGANDFVEMRFGPRFKQQRNDDDGERMVFPTPAVAPLWRGKPGFDLGEPLFADARMQDGLELFAGGRIGKDDFGEFLASQFTGAEMTLFPEGGLNFGQSAAGRAGRVARAISSVSTICAPRSRKNPAAVDLPMPTPPVRPQTFMGRNGATGQGPVMTR